MTLPYKFMRKIQIFSKIVLDKWPNVLYYIGVAKDSRCSRERKSCRGAPIVFDCLRVFLSSGRKTLFIFRR